MTDYITPTPATLSRLSKNLWARVAMNEGGMVSHEDSAAKLLEVAMKAPEDVFPLNNKHEQILQAGIKAGTAAIEILAAVEEMCQAHVVGDEYKIRFDKPGFAVHKQGVPGHG